ncbi:MAG: 50S ribosomal protein L15 [Candidatus Micrarchaeota archaeon]|nr:50S ribosomal protein L15 [Candidatus Micrarchaeota archaeon]
MVVRFRKKIKKKRGSKWHGYGSKKKHRGAGNRGGRGRAGLWKHKKNLVSKLGIEIGKRGFSRPLTLVKKKEQKKIITLRALDELAETLGKKEIDLVSLGYSKVVSKGKITKPLIVKVENITESAKARIEEAGGKVVKI